jgi:anaerobic selenocysteine-containing dehydrogenase
LDEVAARFNEIKEKYGPESVIFARGTDRDDGSVARLAYSFGSPNEACLGLSGNSCYLPRVAEMLVTMGDAVVADCSQEFSDRYDNPNYTPPELLVIWGNNPLVSNSDGFYGHWVVECMKRGSKLVVIDPKLTWLASRAQHWLQIRPGTDAALALGMINIIIKENLYDKEFVDKWCYGFGELTKRAAEFPVERVSDITWIPEEKIVAAARMIAQEKPSTLQWGLAIDMTKEGVAAGHALTALWAITGNLDIPGGFIFTMPPYGVWQPWGGAWGFEELLSPEQKAKRIGPDRYPMLATGLFQLASPDMVMDAMETGLPYPIKAAWLQTTNPLPCMGSDVQRTYRALKNLDFVVVVDLFMTPSAVAHADIVLPAATYPERDGLRAVWYQLSAINKVTQIGECKSDMQINLE